MVPSRCALLLCFVAAELAHMPLPSSPSRSCLTALLCDQHVGATCCVNYVTAALSVASGNSLVLTA